MTEFKVGDQVVHVDDADRGVITAVDEYIYEVDFEKDGLTWVNDFELDRIEDQNEQSSFEQSVRRHTDRIANLLIEKNKQYSNSALDPIRVFSKADRTEQLRVRADDKLSRIRNGDTSEDAVLDLCGYLILLRMAAESE